MSTKSRYDSGNANLPKTLDSRFDAAYSDRPGAGTTGSAACVRSCSVSLCRSSERWQYPNAAWTRPTWMGLWALSRGGAVTSRGRRFELSPDCIAIIPPNTPYGTDSLQPFRCVLISITTIGFHSPSPLDVALLTDHHLISQTADIVMELSVAPEESVALEALSLAYGILSKMPPVLGQRQRLPRNIRHALDYMDSNLNRTVDNQELADAVHMHRTAFVRAFQRAVGIPPQTFFRRQRIDEACRRLLDPDSQVVAVSSDMGFSDPSYFCRVFRQVMHTSPSRWQREALNQLPT